MQYIEVYWLLFHKILFHKMAEICSHYTKWLISQSDCNIYLHSLTSFVTAHSVSLPISYVVSTRVKMPVIKWKLREAFHHIAMLCLQPVAVTVQQTAGQFLTRQHFLREHCLFALQTGFLADWLATMFIVYRYTIPYAFVSRRLIVMKSRMFTDQSKLTC